METIRTSREQRHGADRNQEAGQRLDQLIGQMEQKAPSPSGTALDNQGHAPQATCSRFLYCV